MIIECHWPFHNDASCSTCAEYDRLYAEGVDEYLRQKQEIREIAKARKREAKNG